MISQQERDELAKILLTTEDEILINQVKDLLLMQTRTWESLPDTLSNAASVLNAGCVKVKNLRSTYLAS